MRNDKGQITERSAEDCVKWPETVLARQILDPSMNGLCVREFQDANDMLDKAYFFPDGIN